MLKFGQLSLTAAPRIAVPLSDVEVREHAATLVGRAAVFELRIDQFERHDPDYVADVCREAATHGVPLLATIRAVNEGGKAALSDPERLAIFQAVVPLVDALDIEFHARICADVAALAHRHHKLVIASYHDFECVPVDKDLVSMILTAKRHGADIVKLAVTAHNPADTDRLLGLLREYRAKQLIVIALGPHGAISRVAFPLFGSLLTYAYLHEANAPGQYALDDLIRDLSRFSPEFAADRPRN